MKLTTTDDIESLAIGAGILGTGGGSNQSLPWQSPRLATADALTETAWGGRFPNCK